MAEKRGSVLDPLSWSDPIVRVYEACVDELLINLAKHFNVSAMGNIESFRYEVEMLAKMGAIRQETARIIARHIAQNEPMIEEALKTAMLDSLETVEPELKHAAAEGLLNGTDMEVSDFVKSKLTSYSRQAKNQLNLVNTVMLEGTAEAYRKGVYAAVDIVRQLDAAQETLNVETGKVITGTSTLQQATRAAVRAMSQNGITGFVDRGGHRWSAEAYVRMDLKTTCSNAANRAVMDRNESYGNDLIWVRTNATARPGCYPWQGKVISMQDRARDVTDGNGNRVHAYAVSQTTYGQPDGIFGINCHHGPMNVFVPGLSYIRGAGTAPDQAENDRLYELTQQQRKLERQVRYAKRDAAMYDAAGDREAFEKAALKVKQKNAQLKAFVKEHDSLVLRSDRTQVLGYNRSVSSKAEWAVRKTTSKGMGQEMRVVSKIENAAVLSHWKGIKKNVILTDERIAHIREGHDEDYQQFGKFISSAIRVPDIVLEDAKNEDTAFFIKSVSDSNINVVVKVAYIHNKEQKESSVITMYRLGEKTKKRLVKNNFVVYKKED